MKRKRISSCLPKKTVRFDLEHKIMLTYSPDEYDRGGLFDNPVLYKLNPNAKPKLSVDIPPFILSDDGQDSANSTEPSPDTPGDNDFPPPMLGRSNRPKLSVDTSICAGPLFFTKLSTNHRSRADDDNGYLVPISALPV
ncbi:hypothetical protein BJV82DRAFT_512188 [Fennellomyces sp. T-0311]|nr:hypothetical protein BJV82DRAFT_512188 [Fennellomyces sp. T-0311]